MNTEQDPDDVPPYEMQDRLIRDTLVMACFGKSREELFAIYDAPENKVMVSECPKCGHKLDHPTHKGFCLVFNDWTSCPGCYEKVMEKYRELGRKFALEREMRMLRYLAGEKSPETKQPVYSKKHVNPFKPVTRNDRRIAKKKGRK